MQCSGAGMRNCYVNFGRERSVCEIDSILRLIINKTPGLGICVGGISGQLVFGWFERFILATETF